MAYQIVFFSNMANFLLRNLPVEFSKNFLSIYKYLGEVKIFLFVRFTTAREVGFHIFLNMGSLWFYLKPLRYMNRYFDYKIKNPLALYFKNTPWLTNLKINFQIKLNLKNKTFFSHCKDYNLFIFHLNFL